MPPSEPLTRRRAAFGAGFLLVLTFLLPAAAPDGQLVSPWQELENIAQWSLADYVFRLGGWLVGLALVACGFLLRGLKLSLVYLVLAAVMALAVFAVVRPDLQGIVAPRASAWLDPATWTALTLAASWLVLTATGVRGRLGGRTAVCVFQVLAAAAFTAVASACLYDRVTEATERLPAESAAVWWDVLFPTAAQLLLVLAGLYALAEGLAGDEEQLDGTRSAEHTERTRTAQVATGLGLFALLGYWLVAPAVQQGSSGPLFARLPPALIAIAVAMVFLEGPISLLCELGTRSAAPEREKPAGEP